MALRTMILLDPELEPDSSRHENVVAPLGVRRPRAPWAARIPSRQTLNRFLVEAQAAARVRGEVTVLLTNDAAIRRLNRQFRGKNQATDVLSFSAEPGPEKIAGDLAISVDTARKQAAEQGHALTCELKVLMLHGLLHLAGFDHESDSGEMARREIRLRERLGLPVGLIERSGGPTLRAKGRAWDGAPRESRFPAGMTARKTKAKATADPLRQAQGKLSTRPSDSLRTTGSKRGRA